MFLYTPSSKFEDLPKVYSEWNIFSIYPMSRHRENLSRNKIKSTTKNLVKYKRNKIKYRLKQKISIHFHVSMCHSLKILFRDVMIYVFGEVDTSPSTYAI